MVGRCSATYSTIYLNVPGSISFAAPAPSHSTVECRYLAWKNLVPSHTNWGHSAGGGTVIELNKLMNEEIEIFLRKDAVGV